MPLNGETERNTIYISLDTRPRPGEYHWGLLLTDSHAKPVLHHVSNRSGPWRYLEQKGNPDQSLSLIALVRVSQVNSRSLAKEMIPSIPADGHPSPRTGEAFTCRIWVKDVLMALHERGVIVLPTDIETLESAAVECGFEYSAVSEAGKGATVVNDVFLRSL